MIKVEKNANQIKTGGNCLWEDCGLEPPSVCRNGSVRKRGSFETAPLPTIPPGPPRRLFCPRYAGKSDFFFFSEKFRWLSFPEVWLASEAALPVFPSETLSGVVACGGDSPRGPWDPSSAAIAQSGAPEPSPGPGSQQPSQNRSSSSGRPPCAPWAASGCGISGVARPARRLGARPGEIVGRQPSPARFFYRTAGRPRGGAPLSQLRPQDLPESVGGSRESANSS